MDSCGQISRLLTAHFVSNNPLSANIIATRLRMSSVIGNQEGGSGGRGYVGGGGVEPGGGGGTTRL